MIERRGMDNLSDNSCAELGALFQWVLKPGAGHCWSDPVVLTLTPDPTACIE